MLLLKNLKKVKILSLVSVPSTYSKVYEKDLIKNGFSLVIYANQLLRAAYPAMQHAAKSILEKSRAFEIDQKIISIKEIINLIKMIKADALISLLKKIILTFIQVCQIVF